MLLCTTSKEINSKALQRLSRSSWCVCPLSSRTVCHACNTMLQALPFSKVQHAITTIDAQPSNPSAGPLLVTVTGGLLVDEERNPRITISLLRAPIHYSQNTATKYREIHSSLSTHSRGRLVLCVQWCVSSCLKLLAMMYLRNSICEMQTSSVSTTVRNNNWMHVIPFKRTVASRRKEIYHVNLLFSHCFFSNLDTNSSIQTLILGILLFTSSPLLHP